MFPCPFCFVSLKELQNKINDDSLNFENDDFLEDNVLVKLKTYGDLKKDFEKYESTGKRKEIVKLCNSTINNPLFEERNECFVLEKCIVPELHLLLGFFNHLFWDGLVKVVGRDKALIWPKKLCIVSKSYHGEAFEGPACKKLLKEVDRLNDPDITSDRLKLQPFITAFKAMDKVVECCFSTKKVASDLSTRIQELKKCFYVTDDSETLKVHIHC